jgi:hypothetical protein
LIQREKDSKKSKTIKKAEFTYRSVKAIQSKIYQIKTRVETELDFIKSSFMKLGDKPPVPKEDVLEPAAKEPIIKEEPQVISLSPKSLIFNCEKIVKKPTD